MALADNIASVRERIARAAARAGRSADEVTLMAVSKTFRPDAIREAYACGLRVFGESRVQEFAAKQPLLADLADVKWHLIGHLQSNKAKKAAELFAAVDSVDSLALARKLNDAAERFHKRVQVLIEVNIGGEEAKTGVAPESGELDSLLENAVSLAALDFRGFMTVPPYRENPEEARAFFRCMRELRDQIARRKLPRVGTNVLSMGMSHDFEVAIEEGSTCVRVGTAIFGEREK
jgi:PLP dependent protein